MYFLRVALAINLSLFINFYAFAEANSSATGESTTKQKDNNSDSTKPEPSSNIENTLTGLLANSNTSEYLQIFHAKDKICKEYGTHHKNCKEARKMFDNYKKQEDAKQKAEMAEKQREILKDLKEECKEARESYEDKIRKKKDSEKTLQDEQFELEEQIRELEEGMAKDQRDLSEGINQLQNTTNQNIQTLKDNLRDRLETSIDKEIQNLQKKIFQIQTKQEGIKVKIDAAYFNRREVINKLYANCYSEAKVKTDQLRKTYLEKRKYRQIKASNFADLAAGTKQNMQAKFQAKFDFYLHLCLKRPDIEVQRQDAQTKLTLALKSIEYEKRELQKELLRTEDQIQHLATNRKVAILTEFKEKMHQETKRFNKEYELKLNNLQSKRKQVTEKVSQIRQRQMQEKMRVQQANMMVTPQDKQLQMLMYKCNKDNNLLYSNPGLSSASSTAVQ